MIAFHTTQLDIVWQRSAWHTVVKKGAI